MNRPRFTIGRLMVVVALVAVYLGLVRAFPNLNQVLLGLGYLGGSTWLGLVGLRRRPRSLPKIVMGVYLIFTVAALVGSRFGIAPVWILLPLMMIVAQPVIFGGGISWMRKSIVMEPLPALWEFAVVGLVILPSFLVTAAMVCASCFLLLFRW